jgi:hypothetical protein
MGPPWEQQQQQPFVNGTNGVNDGNSIGNGIGNGIGSGVSRNGIGKSGSGSSNSSAHLYEDKLSKLHLAGWAHLQANAGLRMDDAVTAHFRIDDDLLDPQVRSLDDSASQSIYLSIYLIIYYVV